MVFNSKNIFSDKFSIKTLLQIFLLFGIINAILLIPNIINREIPNYYCNDTNKFFLPIRTFGINQISDGNFPFYVPVFSGHDISSFGQGYFYPTFLLSLYIKIPNVSFFLFDLWLHWTIAGLMMALYCLRIRLSIFASVIAGIIYSYNPPVLMRFQGHLNFLHQIAFYPALFFIAEEIIHRRFFKNAKTLIVCGGVVFGLLLLAQQPQMIYYLSFVLPAYILIRLLLQKNKKQIPGSIAVSICIAVLGICFSAPVILPMIFSLKSSFRNCVTVSDISAGWGLSFTNLYSMLYPDFFILHSAFWGEPSVTESLFAITPIATLLSAIAVFMIAAKKTVRCKIRLLMSLLIILFAFAIGPASKLPWYDFLVKHFPMYASFRAHGRTILLIVIAFSVLSAEGIEIFIKYIYSGCSKKILLLSFIILNIIIVLFSVFIIFRFSNPANFENWLNSHSLYPNLKESVAFESIETVITTVFGAVFQTLMPCALLLLIGICALLKNDLRKKLTIFLVAVMAIIIIKDINIGRKMAFADKTPPLNELVPAEINNAFWEISKMKAPHGKMCNLTGDFKNLSLMYKNIEDITGIDGNISAKYGMYLNKIQKLKANINQVDSFVIVLNEDILRTLSIRWILTDKKNDVIVDVKTGKFNKIAEGGGLNLYEYTGWTPEILAYKAGNTHDIKFDVLESKPGYLKIKIDGKGEKRIVYKSVVSPYWKAEMNGKNIKWTEEDIWMNVITNEEGILEFKFYNHITIIGIYLSIASILISAIILAFPLRRRKGAPSL